MSAGLARNWWAVGLRGVASVLFGFGVLALPSATRASLVLLFAAYVATDGVFAILAGTVAARRGERWQTLILEGATNLALAGAVLERRDIEVNGKSASVFCIRQPDGTFGITTDVDRPFRVRVENHIEEPRLIHWHGLTPPWQQDGVPETSGVTIPAGGSADYNFPLRSSGTYWMHSHHGLQEQLLLSKR